MSCHNCARRTLGLFIRSFANVEPTFAPKRTWIRNAQPSRLLHASTARAPYKSDQRDRAAPPPPPQKEADIEAIAENAENAEDDALPAKYERPAWQAHKAALKEKLNGEAWNPRKKLSPDTMEGIRHLHSTQPDKFTTPVLAQHFKVSPEAIRRILKSKWQPSDEEYEARMERWNKRGERIWTNLVEMGVKPPKKWREMGVGRARGGERPKWKSDRRNLVHVRDSASDSFMMDDGDIIPIVDGTGKARRAPDIPLTRRL
jgi:hypothetical protein